jgi:hypothetical protein
MLNRYRILNAILALREFTVADLAHYSGTKENTVRTVLARESRFVERVGTRGQGRRGGQPVQYQLRTDAEHELVGILREVDNFGADLPPLTPNCSEADPVMLSLIAAEDVLLRQLPTAGPEDRAELLNLATADFETVEFLADQGEVAVHRALIDLLLRLSEVEQEASALTPDANEILRRQQASALAASSHEAVKKLDALGRDLYKLLQQMPAVSHRDPRLLPDLFHRIGTSPFGAVVAASCRAEP